MPDALRPFVSRVLASVIAALASWLVVRFGVEMKPAEQDAAVVVLLGFFNIVYSLVHKWLDKHVNPSDAASHELVEHGMTVNDNLKAKP